MVQMQARLNTRGLEDKDIGPEISVAALRDFLNRPHLASWMRESTNAR